MSVLKELQERMEKLLILMEDRDRKLEWVCMTRDEVEALLEMMEEPETAGEKNNDLIQLGKAYNAGFKEGGKFAYNQAINDVIRKLERMQFYGGNKQEKRADGVPEHHAGRAADHEQKL